MIYYASTFLLTYHLYFLTFLLFYLAYLLVLTLVITNITFITIRFTKYITTCDTKKSNYLIVLSLYPTHSCYAILKNKEKNIGDTNLDCGSYNSVMVANKRKVHI